MLRRILISVPGKRPECVESTSVIGTLTSVLEVVSWELICEGGGIQLREQTYKGDLCGQCVWCGWDGGQSREWPEVGVDTLDMLDGGDYARNLNLKPIQCSSNSAPKHQSREFRNRQN